jgi:hypothetical protein
MAAWKDAGSLNVSKIFAVPITKFQSDVLRSLAAHRSPDSYIAGGVAINRSIKQQPGGTKAVGVIFMEGERAVQPDG